MPKIQPLMCMNEIICVHMIAFVCYVCFSECVNRSWCDDMIYISCCPTHVFFQDVINTRYLEINSTKFSSLFYWRNDNILDKFSNMSI